MSTSFYGGCMKNILGIDLGTNSIGWALLQSNAKQFTGVTASGARVFSAGLDDLDKDGRGKSRNTARREARSVRRILERRKRRLVNLANALQSRNLLPGNYDFDKEIDRHNVLNDLDKNLSNPYILRAKALDEKLSLIEIGRILYHICHRRGFLSNRKSLTKDSEEGKVKEGISQLDQEIKESHSRTLGEYFSKRAPKQLRIRGKYTSRKMYKDEFHRIWDKQKSYYPEILDDEYKERIFHIIFHQRPLKSQKHLVGKCELEKTKHRSALCLLLTQRFRYFQVINNLLIVDENDHTERQPDQSERETITEYLEQHAEVKLSKIRKLLKLPKSCKFNYEFGGVEKIKGNTTTSKIVGIIGTQKWDSLDETDQCKLIRDLLCFVSDKALVKRLRTTWGFNDDEANKLSKLKLEPGYGGFSQSAMLKLLPLLENGVPLQTAIKEKYPERWAYTGNPVDILPPVNESGLAELRNPIVERSLTELRKVVNQIIRRYGKPDKIHIELARDLRQTAKQRIKVSKKNKRNEKLRNEAAVKLRQECNIEDPSRNDILKILLAEECNWECPYTGKKISISALFGSQPQFDIEHIIPFERSLDNSYLNKTLCDSTENRNRKKNFTPYEAYGQADDWDEILSRVKAFKGDAKRAKIQRFMMSTDETQKMFADFTERQLNDTKWTAKWAKQYVGLLYGGINDNGVSNDGRLCVQAISGGITGYLRSLLNLNAVLGNGSAKSRDDHRHHAVDAVVIALADANTVKTLNVAARRGRDSNKLFSSIEAPWDGFLDDVRAIIHGTTTSHKKKNRVRGKLHEDTFYSPPKQDATGEKQYVTVRKALENLTEKEVENIVDPVVKALVKQQLKKLDGTAKTCFADPQNHPLIKTKTGKKIPIHRVRIRTNSETIQRIGADFNNRFVESKTNHHMEIYEVTRDKQGKVVWETCVVSMLEAHRRLKENEPVIKRDHGINTRYLFSLAKGDIIELDGLENQTRALYVVKIVPQSKQIYFIPINDARKPSEIGKNGLTAVPESLHKRNCEKKFITPLGEVRNANN